MGVFSFVSVLFPVCFFAGSDGAILFCSWIVFSPVSGMGSFLGFSVLVLSASSP